MRVKAKYRAIPTVVDGIRFASKREAHRYGELKLLQRAGEISGLILQPRYGLWIVPFARVDANANDRIKCGDYVGDFQYFTKAGEKVVEDVKGVKTAIYKLKAKIVLALYGITIEEI